ncbi:MAG: NAD-binding protein [Coriobacteriales bacterium]|jgi:3-hydroxyisobutyrate dehydrogenase|nr:NAD-binding protein [Coriobacteriales bacterium]
MSKTIFIFSDRRGLTLAEKLAAAGHDLCGFVPAAAAFAPQTSLPQVTSLPEALGVATVVLSLLEGPAQIEEVYLERNGVLQNAQAGCCFVDLSVTAPRFAREMHALASVHDCYFADAPLSANIAGLQPDAARALLGCEENIREQVTALLHDAGLSVLHCGLPGSGAAARIATLATDAAMLLGVAEALAYVRGCKLSDQAAAEFLLTSPLRSESERALIEMALQGRFKEGYPLRRFYQEITVALDAADDLNLAMPVIETTHQLLDLLMMIGAAEMGVQALTLVFSEEEYCKQWGLDWDLAQRFMDVYEHAQDDYDDYDDDDFDDSDDGFSRRFSTN